MELADYLRVLRRRWWLIALAIVVCTVGSGAASWTRTPTYVSSTRLTVSGGEGENSVDQIARRQVAITSAVAYAQYVGTGPAVSAALENAGVTGTSGVAVVGVADGSNPFISITVNAHSAKAAQAVANAYVSVLPDVIVRLEQMPPSSRPKISTLEAAPLPARPVSPNHKRDVTVGFILGLVLGVAGALVRETLDARVRDSSEIERITGSTLLGSIPRENASEALVSMTRPRSGRAEAYRHVRTNLEFTGPDGMPRSIVVTSAAPGEGKSSLSANLAVVAARSGRNVILVDADLRKPSVAKYFGVQSSVGLSDVLAGRWAWQEALVPVEGERIHILTSGPVPRFPSELVGSAAMTALIEELEQSFDFVIIDTPPVLPVSDALVIGVNVGGVIVVGRMVETRRVALKRAVDAVRKVNANLLGVVGNAVVKQEERAYGEGYGYAYGYISNAPQEQFPPASIKPAVRRDEESKRRGRHANMPHAAADEDLPFPLAFGGQSGPTHDPVRTDQPQPWMGAPEPFPSQTVAPQADFSQSHGGAPLDPRVRTDQGPQVAWDRQVFGDGYPRMAPPPPGGLQSPPTGVRGVAPQSPPAADDGWPLPWPTDDKRRRG